MGAGFEVVVAEQNWCSLEQEFALFQTNRKMGNYMCVSVRHRQVQDECQWPPTKVIRADGTIEVYKHAVTAGELMKQYPDHSVCHSSAMTSALTESSALPAEKELEGGRLYYVLPTQKFHQASKSEGKVASPGSRGKTASAEIRSTPGFAQVTVKGEAGAKLFYDKHGGVLNSVEDSEKAIISYSTPDLKSLHLKFSLTRSNSWKPCLETINEVSADSRRHVQNFMQACSLQICRGNTL